MNNPKQSEVGVLPFPPLPMQVHPVPQPRQTNRVPLVIGTMVSVGLIAFLIAVVPWGLVSQRLTNSVDSWSDQVKQVQFAQVKQSKKASAPPEDATPAPSKVETTPTLEGSAPEAPIVETPSTSAVSSPASPADETRSATEEVSTSTTPSAKTAPVTPVPEPDPRLLVGRYPVRKYTYIRDKIAKDDTLYNFIREYGNQIYPKKYRDWKQLARYNAIPPPQYTLKLGTEFRIPTLEYMVLPKTGYETELKQIQSELAKQPNNPELLNQQAVIHFKRNELNQARSTLRRGIRTSPKNGVLHNNLGFIYLILEDDQRAQSEFELAITQSEKPAIPHSNLGILYMTIDKFDQAIKAFDSALRADANLLDAKYNLAIAHEKTGNVDSAREHLGQLARLLSDDPEVTSALERLTSSQVTGE